MEDCIFCKIAQGKIPCAKLYEDEGVLAFLDIAPANKGHTLVIPKQHFELFTELPDELLDKLVKTVKKLAGKISKALSPDGYNIINNNKKASGQLVPHAHFHIIPRFEGDNQEITWTPGKYKEGELEKVKAQILG